MKTIYSILYLTLNASLNERVSIGIVMADNNRFKFRYSLHKLKLLKDILSKDSYNLTSSYLKSLETDFNQKDNTHVLFDNNHLPIWATENSLDYLSRYANNIIQFSSPTIIDIPFNNENFIRLFEKYVFPIHEKQIITKENKIFKQVETKLYPKIEKHVNLKVTLDNTVFKELISPVNIDFIGINKRQVVGQTLDFNKRKYYLENDLMSYIALSKIIDSQKNKKGHYFVVGKEPSKEDKINHLLWKNIYKGGLLEFVDIEETDKIIEYMENHDVQPYFSDKSE